MKWLIWMVPAIALAQPFSFGVKVGAPVTDAFNVTGTVTNFRFSPDTKRLVIGPTAELRLPFGFGIEMDALYRRYEYNLTSSSVTAGSVVSGGSKSGSWEFPVLAKVRAGFPLVKPYAVGGLAFQKLTGVKQTLGCIGGTCNTSLNDLAHDSNVGLVLGGGLEVHLLKVKISPELRYTRWGFANWDLAAGSGSLKSNQNQADVLVGITF